MGVVHQKTLKKLKMADKTWKATERRIAGMFNTYRTPLSGGSSRQTQSDTLHSTMFIEIKHRKFIPFLKTFKETILKAEKEDKVPLVVFVERYSKTPIVMCDIRDLRKIAEALAEGVERGVI